MPRVTLGRDVSGTSLAVNPDELAGSTNAFVYVQVSDGFNTASAHWKTRPSPPYCAARYCEVNTFARSTENQSSAWTVTR